MKTFGAILLGLTITLAVRPVEGGATWGVNLGNSTLSIDADTYADNGANGFKPGGAWGENDPPILTTFQSNFVIGPNTFDLGAALNPITHDRDPNIPFDTSASAVGVITINGIGSNTLDIDWRLNTLNDQFGGDGFLSDSSAFLASVIEATINGVGPGTPLQIQYDWNYFATAVEDHENLVEDPESASGDLGFSDDKGNGPGNLFATLVGGPGLATDIDSGSNTFNLVTSNPMSFLSIDLHGGSTASMNSPGSGPPNDEDLAGSEFIGHLTLRLVPVPEPTSLALAALAAAGIFAAGAWRRR